MKHYYPTGLESDSELLVADQKNKKQERIVLDYLKARPGQHYTAYELEAALGLLHQSMHRCLANLTAQDLIVKSHLKQKISPYGKRVHTWVYQQKSKPMQERLF